MKTKRIHCVVQLGAKDMNKLVFIIGSPHSGTTWVNNWLCEHPCVGGHKETYFLTYLIEAFKTLQTKGWADDLGCSTIRSIYMNAINEDKDVTLMHDNWLIHYGVQLEEIFPSAYYLVFHRDGRRVAASLKNRIALVKWRHFPRSPGLIEMKGRELTKRWSKDMQAILNDELPRKTLVMRYDDIVNLSRTITQFIGIDHHKDIDPAKLVNCSFKQLKGEDFWKEFLSEEDCEHFTELKDLLRRAGYIS